MTSMQQEAQSLRQQLDEARLRFASTDREDGDKLGIMLASIQSDHEKVRSSDRSENVT